MADWTADANDALTIQLVRSERDSLRGEEDDYEEFHPAFTYPVRHHRELIGQHAHVLINVVRYMARTRSCMDTETF